MSTLLTSLLTLLGVSTAPSFANLGVEEFAELIDKPGVVVLDVRTPQEYAEGHIAGAVNVDVNASDFMAQIRALKLPKGKAIAVYCRSGRRSAHACSLLAKDGYTKLHNLTTGIIGWTEAGRKVV